MKKLQSSNKKNAYALVDDDVYETIKDIGLKFSIQNKGHGRGHFQSTTEIQLSGMPKKKRLLLHRFVWLLKTGELPSSTVDHIDRNPSNNQFSNLRLATRLEQSQHRGKMKNNKSSYIGVCCKHEVDKRRKKKYEYDYWYASISRQDGKCKSKRFKYTKNGLQHAAMWYDDHAREYFGKFCGELNFPSPSDKK